MKKRGPQVHALKSNFAALRDAALRHANLDRVVGLGKGGAHGIHAKGSHLVRTQKTPHPRLGMQEKPTEYVGAP